VLAIAFLFFISLVISTVLPAVNHFLSGGDRSIGGLVALAATLISFTLVFATGYKFLPDADVAWRDVWIAALIAAVLFTLGKRLLSAYLVRSGGASIYGATGSVAVILVWVYYSARVFFFGAEFTQVYSRRQR
jgi:membrane protein